MLLDDGKAFCGWLLGGVHSPIFPSLHLRHSSFSNPSVTLPTSQLILQPFRHFTYVTAHSPTLPLFHLRHSSFSNPSLASPTSQALHLRHLWAAHAGGRRLEWQGWVQKKNKTSGTERCVNIGLYIYGDLSSVSIRTLLTVLNYRTSNDPLYVRFEINFLLWIYSPLYSFYY